jgi:LPXTG-motif cell wall-anchored protein
MLTFLLGRSGSGKTKYILNEIEKCVKRIKGEMNSNITITATLNREEALKNAEETLAKLGSNADTESPNTGESSNVWVLFALMASIGSGILGITIRRKKKISL